MDGLTWKVVFEYKGLTIQGPQSRDWRLAILYRVGINNAIFSHAVYWPE